MFEISTSRVVACDQFKVFDYISNLENDPEWWYGVIKSHCISRNNQGVGTKFWQKAHLIGIDFCLNIEIIDYQRPSKLVYQSFDKTALSFVATFLFESTEHDTTKITMLSEVKTKGLLFRLMGHYFESKLKYVTEQNFNNLKRILDNYEVDLRADVESRKQAPK